MMQRILITTAALTMVVSIFIASSIARAEEPDRAAWRWALVTVTLRVTDDAPTGKLKYWDGVDVFAFFATEAECQARMVRTIAPGRTDQHVCMPVWIDQSRPSR